MKPRFLHVGVFLLVTMYFTFPSPGLSEVRIGPEVMDELTEKAAVRVMIMFEVPVPPTLTKSGYLTSSEGRAAIVRERDRVLRVIPYGEFKLLREFQTVNGIAGEISERGLLALSREPISLRIDLDAGGEGSLAESGPLVNSDDVQMSGYTGVGTTVAVLDSGYDSNHDDLSDDLVAEQCFCSDNGAGCCPDGSETQSGTGSAEDDHGHGTNVTGIVTSKGMVASDGVAPDADIVAVKVLDSNNGFCCTSDVVAGLDWVATNFPRVESINMSLGTFALFPGECDDATAFTMALATAIDNLRNLGVPVFASSGNSASGTEMGAPACVGNTISVGAVYDADIGSASTSCTDPVTAPDLVTCFTNSNDTTDLFAPGARITSSGIGGGTSSFFGTSQASPHAAACAALLQQVDPTLTPGEIEDALEASPIQVTDATNGLSFPRLDCLDALDHIGSIFADGFETGDVSAWTTSSP